MRKLVRPGIWRTMVQGAAALALFATAASAQSQAAPRDHVVTMTSMSFGRIPTDVKVGDTITWINRDTVQHTATARDKSFDLRIAAGKSAKMTVQKAGTIPFYCIYHTMMRGTLKVAG